MAPLDQPSRWSLTDLFPAPAAEKLDSALAGLEQAVCDFEAMRPLLSATISARDFQAVLAKLEAIVTRKSRIEAFADLSFFQDTGNVDALSLRDRVSQILVNVGNRCLFFDFWFRDLSEETAARLVAESGDLHYFLEGIRRLKPFSLTEAEEKIIN